MFKKILKRIFYGPKQKKIDPSIFNDPLALKTCWTPMFLGPCNVWAHKLTRVNSSRIEFKVGIWPKVFSLIILIGGGAFTIFSLFYSKLPDYQSRGLLVFAVALLVFACGLVTLFGWYLLYQTTIPIIFDKGRRLFWKGSKKPWKFVKNKNVKSFAKLDNIHAIQLLSKKIIGPNSYYRFELNLVLKNSHRLNVVDYSGTRKIDDEAKALSLFLGKPLWDAI